MELLECEGGHNRTQAQGLPWWQVAKAGQQSSTMAEAEKRNEKHSLHGAVDVYQNALTDHPIQILGHTATSPVGHLVPALLPVTAPQGGGRGDENRAHYLISVNPSCLGEYTLPHTNLELGHSMIQAYPYANQYFGGIATAYGGQAMIHPFMVGAEKARIPLASEVVDEPVYVNAKQYYGILRRRQSRAKLESKKKLIKSRKPYLHESRHLHAVRRPRGCGGRFLNTKSKEESKGDKSKGMTSDSDVSQQGNSNHGAQSGQGSVNINNGGQGAQCLVEGFLQGGGGVDCRLGMPPEIYASSFRQLHTGGTDKGSGARAIRAGFQA